MKSSWLEGGNLDVSPKDRGPSEFCEMSAMVTTCVTDAPRCSVTIRGRFDDYQEWILINPKFTLGSPHYSGYSIHLL